MRKQDRIAQQQQQISPNDEQHRLKAKAPEKMKGSAAPQPTHPQRQPGSKLPLPD